MSKRFVTIIALVLILLVFVVLILLSFNLFPSSPGINQDSEYISIKSNIETCLDCHINTKGYSNYHNPELIGCTSCHLGNKNESDKDKSHEGMILIPGNLSDAEQTCGKCHPEELRKINNSLMTTNSGLVAVDKFVFGEADSPDYHYHIKDLGFSPADKHLRDLCANCHLGAQKTEFGAIGQLSRGGGCNACHLNYSEDAIKDLDTYLASDKTKLPLAHPSTDIFVTNEHCFGCHSRSSRISTNYEGWQETLLDEEDIENSTKFRVLDDKRVYLRKQEDIHFTKGLLCIDCHSSHEVMGNGKLYTHEEQAVTLQCSDCHYKEKPNTIIVDTSSKHLYYVMEDGKAMRYGIGIGRDGFEWSGKARVAAKRKWPTWTPPPAMIGRQPELAKYRKGMKPGLTNPLGARALYLHNRNGDTGYRLHGSPEWWSIGKAVSSGCIRLMNQDIIDLYERTDVGTKVVVK